MDEDLLEEKLLNNALLFISIRKNIPVEEKIKDVTEYLNQGADVNAGDANNKNNTPLHVAVQKGERELVELLLKNGANINQRNSNNLTALDVVQNSKTVHCEEIVQILTKYSGNSIQVEQDTCSNKLNNLNTKQSIQKKRVSSPQYHYQKRKGTSGFSGHLYETKLLSLILLRALHCKNMKKFFLATNVYGVGAFDDVVFRYELSGMTKSKLIFLQAKHRDDPTKDKVTIEDVLKPNGDFSLHKYLDSYLQIIDRFSPDSNDVVFKGSRKSVNCDFIIFTSAVEQFAKKKPIDQSEIDAFLRIDDSPGKVFKFDYDDTDLKLLINTVAKTRAVLLANTLSRFILKDNKAYNNMMMNDLIKTYHVFLAQNVIAIDSEAHGESTYSTNCVGKFRTTFLASDDELMCLMKRTIYKKMTEIKVIKKTEKESAIGTKIAQHSFKLPINFGNANFRFEGSEAKKLRRLKHIVSKFKNILPKECNGLSKLIFVRIDESMVGSGKPFQETDFEYYRLGGLIGNLLMLDNETNMLKFNWNDDNLSDDNLDILGMLRQEYDDLTVFRLDIDVRCFPKLSLYDREHDRQTVTEFLNNLKFYTNQVKECGLENVAAKEIDKFCISKQGDLFFQIKRDAIFLRVHDKIQKWWQQSAKVSYLTETCRFYEKAQNDILHVPVLSILNLLFRESVKRLTVDFKSSVIASLGVNEFLQNGDRLMVINSDEISFTCKKLINHLNYTNTREIVSFVNINKSFLNNYFDVVKSEFKHSNIQVLVLVCQENVDSIDGCEKILTILKEFHGKVILISSILTLIMAMENAFIEEHVKIKDKTNFNDLTDLVRKKTLEEGKILFQGEEIAVGSLLSSDILESSHKGLLRRVIMYDQVRIGETLSSPCYDDIADYFINRSVCRYMFMECTGVVEHGTIEFGAEDQLVITSNDSEQYFVERCNEFPDLNIHWFIEIDNRLIWKRSRGSLNNISKNLYRSFHDAYNVQVETLMDITDKVVVISAEPGMGKSTLLTHLAIQTKRKHPNLWISKINLNEHVSYFSQWKNKLTDVNLLEAFRFLYNAIGLSAETNKVIKIQTMEKIFRKMSIDNLNNIHNSDEALFEGDLYELNLFNQLYNNNQVVLLFDGFDEICPDYANEVIQLLNILKHSKILHLWVTTRSQNVFITLEISLGTFSYNLQPLTTLEQKTFLQKVWAARLGLGDAFSAEMTFRVETFLLLITILLRERSFTTIPLHLYMISDYFESYFKDYYDPYLKQITDTGIFNAFRNFNLFSLYEMFVEIKFFRIRFGEKKPVMCFNDPDLRRLVEKEYEGFLEGHKIVGAYMVLDKDIVKELFSEQDTIVMNNLIEDVKLGQDKTGIIECIAEDGPKFVHFTFAEYFATKFIFDKLLAGLLTGKFQQKVLDTTLENRKGSIRRFVTSRIEKDVQQSYDCHVHTITRSPIEPLVMELNRYVSPPENTCTKEDTVCSFDRNSADPDKVYIGRISYFVYIRFNNYVQNVDVVWGRQGEIEPYRNPDGSKSVKSEYWYSSEYTRISASEEFELTLILFSLMHAITISRKNDILRNIDLSVCELVIHVKSELYHADYVNSTTWSSMLRLRV